MTTELEKQFFDTFEIEQKQVCGRKNSCNNYVNYKDCNGCYAYKYPKITDLHYLELICILNKFHKENYQCCTLLIGATIERLKYEILSELMECSTNLGIEVSKCNKIKHQVQELFKGE